MSQIKLWITTLAIAALSLPVAAQTGKQTTADAKNTDIKSATAAYNSATAKAKKDFDAAVAACNKGAADQKQDCYAKARKARRDAREQADETYAKVTGRPEPPSGH